MHPSVVDGGGVFPDGDVLGNVGKARARAGEPLFKARLAGKLVLHDIEIEHQQRVPPRGLEERVVPLQLGKMVRGAFVVEQLKQFAFGFVARRLRLRAGKGSSKKHKRCQGQDRSELFHSSENQPRTRTALKLTTTWPPAVGRPKLSIGLKREKSSI